MFSDHGLSPAGTSSPLLLLPSPPRASVAPYISYLPTLLTLPYLTFIAALFTIPSTFWCKCNMAPTKIL